MLKELLPHTNALLEGARYIWLTNRLYKRSACISFITFFCNVTITVDLNWIIFSVNCSLWKPSKSRSLLLSGAYERNSKLN